MVGVYVLIGFAVLMATAGGFLLCGKGSWLIAGYNTATPQQKAKYDRRKLCRVMGIFCLFVALLQGGLAFFGARVETGAMPENAMLGVGLGFAGLVLAGVIFVGVYMNKHCLK